MKKQLRDSLPLAEGISRLLFPFAEVVVHDLSKDRIEAIYNPFSRREVGDSSYLDRIKFKASDKVVGPYEKTNWDGRPLKCVSIILRDEKGKPQGFVCVNLDVSQFKTLTDILGSFLNDNARISEEDSRLFKDDTYERINIFVQKYCRKKGVTLDSLGKSDRLELIGRLAEEGAFQEKNAASYIGRVMGVSRATVYNYLKETEEM